MAQDPAHAVGIPALRKAALDSVKDLTVDDLNYNKQPVVLDVATEPKKAIEILLENKIRAAPVIDNNKYIGVLDLRDLVKNALKDYKNNKKQSNLNQALQWLTIVTSKSKDNDSLSNLAKIRSFRCVKQNDSLISVLIPFAKGSHIVGISSNDGSKLVGVLTQGQLFQQLAKKV